MRRVPHFLAPPSPCSTPRRSARSVLDETEVPDCKLATLACFFGARTRPCHRALADAKATADVLQGLLAPAGATGVRTLAEITPIPGEPRKRRYACSRNRRYVRPEG